MAYGRWSSIHQRQYAGSCVAERRPVLRRAVGLRVPPGLTNKQDGMIVVATLLLLPTSFAVYGVSQVIFAAKEAVEKRAMEKGRRAGIQEGRQEGEQTERERIEKGLAELEESGLRIPPEVAELVARESAASPRTRIVSRRRGNRRGSQR